MWWEHNESFNGTPIPNFIYVNCPVCRTTLGKINIAEATSLHCNECHAVYTFYPGITKPTAKLDSDIAHTCPCPSCRARRGEIELDEEEKPKRVWLPSEELDD